MTYNKQYFADRIFGGPSISIIDLISGELLSMDRPSAFEFSSNNPGMYEIQAVR